VELALSHAFRRIHHRSLVSLGPAENLKSTVGWSHAELKPFAGTIRFCQNELVLARHAGLRARC
jgi:hypothetical protein